MKYKVSILKCESYNSKLIRETLIQSFKNINFQFKKNQKILLKPNILGPYKPEQAITTHPIILEEVCKILKKYNSKIYIGDSSGSKTTEEALKVSEINKLSKYAKIINFDKEPKKILTILGKKVAFPKILFDVDLIINISKMKTHVYTGVTLSIKNLYGCIPGKIKGYFHRLAQTQKNLSKILIEIHELIKPQLNIIDGVTGIEGNGPGTTGTKISPKLIITSNNAFASDIITSKIMGFNPDEIQTNQLSNIKEHEIEVIGEKIKDVKINFKKPNTHIDPFLIYFNYIFPKPLISFNKEFCQKCGICEKNCPVGAITLKTKDNYPICHHNKCIRCFCCIEMCPHNVVSLEDHWLKKSIKSSLKIPKKIIEKLMDFS